MADVSAGGVAVLEQCEQFVLLEDFIRLEVEDRLRTVLHEIRQPVAAVLALAGAARGLPAVTAELSVYLDRIVDQVQEVSGAACSVLAEADEEDDGGPRGGPPVDIREIVGSAIDSFALTWPGTLRFRGRGGPVWTTGTRPAIRRCVVNLLDNAVRAAGPAGTVVITVKRGADSVWTVVEDDGPGFGRVPGGTGIGLPVTRRTLHALGGSLVVGPSREWGGARVAFRLPRRMPDHPDHHRTPVLSF